MLPKWIEFHVETFGFDQVDKYLSNLRPRHLATANQELREWGEEMVFIAKTISPKDKLRGEDWRRRPKDESFAEQWRWQMETDPGGTELQVGNIDPRAGWIIEGTPPRVLAAYSWDRPMYFFWEDGWDGPGWYTSWYIVGGVAEKGTPPHPVHIQTLENFDVRGHITRLASRLK